MTLGDRLLQLTKEFKRFEAQKNSEEFFKLYIYPRMQVILSLVVDNTPIDDFMQKWKNIAIQDVQLDIEHLDAPDFSQKNIEINTRWLDSYKSNIENLVKQFIDRCSCRYPEVLEKEITL